MNIGDFADVRSPERRRFIAISHVAFREAIVAAEDLRFELERRGGEVGENLQAWSVYYGEVLAQVHNDLLGAAGYWSSLDNVAVPGARLFIGPAWA